MTDDIYFRYGFFIDLRQRGSKLKPLSYGSAGHYNIRVPFFFKLRLVAYILFGKTNFTEWERGFSQ